MDTGIAYRDQSRISLHCQKTIPLADISNRNIKSYVKASPDFSLFQDNSCQSDSIYFWNMRELTNIKISKSNIEVRKLRWVVMYFWVYIFTKAWPSLANQSIPLHYGALCVRRMLKNRTNLGCHFREFFSNISFCTDQKKAMSGLSAKVSLSFSTSPNILDRSL